MGERENDREATRERETCNTSNQRRVRERERDHDREAARESQRDMQHATISKEE